PYEGPFANNKCDLEGLANPDNISFISDYNSLIIGEDTGSGHQNDMIWSYNLKSKELTRIQTTPYGSETTSPYIYKNINGFGYLMSVVQHPFGESDADQLNNADEAFAYTGYIGPFPALK
ncbi:alkaline phosphatase, partial [Candidatus Thiomargarita nelsonii]